MSRIFPKPEQDTLTGFVYHSCRMERVPVSFQDIQQTLTGASSNPWLEGQFKAVNLAMALATNPDLIPKTPPKDHRQSLEQLVFLRQLHLNQFRLVAEHAKKLEDTSMIDPKDVGNWRQGPHRVGSTEMPNPIQIQFLLLDWWKELIDFHNQYRTKIETRFGLESPDITALANQAYNSHLKLCCIKPFQDGSNRTARLVENMLRLNWGLPWIVHRSEDQFKLPYVDDIKSIQKNYPA